jgi:hypothetical protein
MKQPTIDNQPPSTHLLKTLWQTETAYDKDKIKIMNTKQNKINLTSVTGRLLKAQDSAASLAALPRSSSDLAMQTLDIIQTLHPTCLYSYPS